MRQKRLVCACWSFGLALVLGAPVQAEELSAAPTEVVAVPAPPWEHAYSVTVSVPHLLVGGSDLPRVAAVTAERRQGDRSSLAIAAGVGRWSGMPATTYEIGRPDSTLWEVGVQGRLYFAGTFDQGLYAGATLMVQGLRFSDSTSKAAGLAVPWVGYKYSSTLGITADFQLGLTLVAGESWTGPGSVYGAADILLGWSFGRPK